MEFDMNTAHPTRNATACIAEISVDGGPATPMVCLLADDGTVTIPTAWDDPPVADGVGHIVHIALASRSGGGAERIPFVLGDYHMWRPDAGAVAISTGGGDDAGAWVLVAAAVPRSVRRAASGLVPRRSAPA
jgi:hypothetical protein